MAPKAACASGFPRTAGRQLDGQGRTRQPRGRARRSPLRVEMHDPVLHKLGELTEDETDMIGREIYNIRAESLAEHHN